MHLNIINMWSSVFKYATLATGSALLFGGALYFLNQYGTGPDLGVLETREPKQVLRPIKDEILVSFLKELKSQSYPNFFMVSSIINQVH